MTGEFGAVAGETVARVPFSILSGFLGAGKTTVLNRLLSRPQGRRIAVLVNELGRVAIDSKLILSRGGDVLELAGGCVCCKVDIKNDLWDGIVDIARRSRPDHIVLETTGIAEPAAILEGLEWLPDGYRSHIEVAGLISVVDARAGMAQLDHHEEARAQVEAADRIMLSKLDVATASEVAAIRERVVQLNAHAETAAFPMTAAGTFGLVPWLLERRIAPRRSGRPHRHELHRHGERQLVAVSFRETTPMLSERLLEVVRSLGDRLVRAKGFVHIAGEERRGFLELAGGELTMGYGEPWTGNTTDEAVCTELVLIGEGLDEASIRRALWASCAGGGSD